MVNKAAPDVAARSGRVGTRGLGIVAAYLISIGLSGLSASSPVAGITALALPLLWIAWEDQLSRTIPDQAIVLIAVLAAIRIWLAAEAPWPDLIAAAGFGGTLWLGSEIYFRRHGQEALGLGDVKLIAALTLWFGAIDIWPVILIASAGGIAAALTDMAKGGQDRHIPFGPFLSGASMLWAVIEIWGG